MGYPLSITKLIVIESLEDFEVKTGEITANFISSQLEDLGFKLPIEYHTCANVFEFKEMMGGLLKEAELGAIPLIHIESHGDPEEGLEFANGSVLGWSELADIIYPINLATKFNLILCLSACYGSKFLGKMGDVERPCPCRVLIAPHKKMSPSEGMHAFREFYKTLFHSEEFYPIIGLIERIRTEDGFWIVETAENWFRFTSRDFVLNNCSKPEVKKRVMGIYKKVKEIQGEADLSVVKKQFMIHYRDVMFQGMFDNFFGLNQVPELRKEFDYLFIELKAWIAEKGRQGLCVY